MPSRRKEGWEVGTEGAGAGVGPPGQRGAVTVWALGKPSVLDRVLAASPQRTSRQETLPLNERSPSRSRSSPPAEAGLVGTVVWMTGTTSFPPKRSNKSLACGTGTNERLPMSGRHHRWSWLSSESKRSAPGWRAGSQAVGASVPQRVPFPRLSERSPWDRWWRFSP